MPNPLVLNSKNYKQSPTSPNPEPRLDVLPKPGDYIGAMKASDRDTLLAPMGSPQTPYPGVPGREALIRSAFNLRSQA